MEEEEEHYIDEDMIHDMMCENSHEAAFNDFQAFIKKHTSHGWYHNDPAKLISHMLQSMQPKFEFSITKIGSTYKSIEVKEAEPLHRRD